MCRKIALLILISSLLAVSPVSAVYSQFILVNESLDSFKVEISSSAAYVSVPFHYQSKNYYCGPATLEMVFDYYGNEVNQTEIADVARTIGEPLYSTFTDELRRAAHFSNLSTSQGDEIPESNITSYSTRKVGYAAFERTGLTIDDLKGLINKGEPIIVLMWYSSAEVCGHFRVVVGYNETHILMHDPWNKQIGGGAYGGANTSMTYSTFWDLWAYSGYWGLWVRPWEVELQMPSSVDVGDNFEVIANITYYSSGPVDTIHYPAFSCKATIELSKGLELALGETAQHSLGNITAGSSVLTSWLVNASETGFHKVSVTATGIVEGTVEAHETYPFYSYEDEIGGSCSTPTPNIFITPTESAASAGETFNININISNAEDIFSWEMRIRFNPALLVVSAVQSGGFLSSAGSTLPLQFNNHSDFGYIVLGESMLEAATADGNGTLVKVTFKVLGTGECTLHLYNTLLFSENLNEIVHKTTNGFFTSMKTRVTFSPQAVFVETGETLNISVICSNVDSLYLYQIYFNFSKEILEIVNITKGEFLSRGLYETFWVPKWFNDEGYAQVWESMFSLDPEVSGTGELFKVIFKAVKAGSCKLDFYSTQLLNPYGSLIPHKTGDGVVTIREFLVHSVVWGDITYNVTTESNSIVTAFNFSQPGKAILLNMTGETGTVGYVNVTIPKVLLNVDTEQPPYQWLVFIDTNPTTPEITTNATHTFIYLTFPHSQHKIEIMGNEAVPEITTTMILPLFIAATLLTIIIYKRKHSKQSP